MLVEGIQGKQKKTSFCSVVYLWMMNNRHKPRALRLKHVFFCIIIIIGVKKKRLEKHFYIKVKFMTFVFENEH